MWAVWHLPEFYNPASTQYAMGMVGFIPLLIMEVGNSIFMTWLYNNTGGSVLVAGVIWHLAIDTFSTTLLSDFTVSGMLAGENMQPVNMELITMLALVMSASALVLVVATKGRLGTSIDDGEKR